MMSTSKFLLLVLLGVVAFTEAFQSLSTPSGSRTALFAEGAKLGTVKWYESNQLCLALADFFTPFFSRLTWTFPHGSSPPLT
jgi:hypothetical protein